MTFPGIVLPSCDSPITIRPLCSITQAQAAIIEQALPTPWRSERHDDYDGYLSIIVFLDRPDSRTLDAPTYVFAGTADRIESSEMQNDNLIPRGCFDTVEAALTALIRLQAT